jgi:hypothetical protein
MFLSSVAVAQEKNDKLSEALKRLSQINTQDGISYKEAQIIAEAYFAKNVGCGVFKGIQDDGKYWRVNAVFGYAATPVKNFRIYKKTGKISSPIGPSYDNPIDIAK